MTTHRSRVSLQIANNIEQQVRKAMKAAGVNQNELAARMRVSKVFVSNLLNKNKNWTLKTLASVADALQTYIVIPPKPRRRA